MKCVYFILFIVILSSCGTYRQNVVNVPIFNQKGQTQISGHISFNGYEGQLACALTKNVAVIANSSYLKPKKDGSQTNYTIEKHNFFELGTGYFKKNDNALYQEYFFIIGKGMTSRFVTGNESILGEIVPFTTFREIKYSRILFQSDFGKLYDKLELAFSPRIFIIHYYNISDNSTDVYKSLSSTYLYSDASLTFRYAITSNFKISAQSSLTIPITGYSSGYYEASPFNCSIGLVINLNFCKSLNQ